MLSSLMRATTPRRRPRSGVERLPTRPARPTLHGALLAAALGALACGEPREPAEHLGPNLLLVSIDSLRPDHLGCYGYGRTTSPVIDRLAAEGVRFATAVSTTSWTLPAHAALFTGMYDSAHGLVDNGLSLSDRHRTLAETLAEHGYQTAGFFGGPYLHPTFGLGQGFGHYQSCMTALADDLGAADVRAQSRAPRGASHDDVTGPRTLEEFGRWLDGAERGRPFFAFVHLWDVHYDYIPPPEFAALFADPAYRGACDGRGVAELAWNRRQLSQADTEHLIALYDAEIRFTDEILGKLLERLSGAGLGDTAVVVTADHGEEFFEHRGWGHQSSLFDEQILVPLIVHWPAAFAPRVVDEQVRLIDVMPTLLALAGASEGPAMQGRSLVPLLLGDELAAEPALSELLVDQGLLRALRSAGEKVLDDRRRSRQGVIDLASDPREAGRLSRDPAARARVDELRAEVQRAQEFGRALGERTRAIEVPPGLEAVLDELGYTDGQGE